MTLSKRTGKNSGGYGILNAGKNFVTTILLIIPIVFGVEVLALSFITLQMIAMGVNLTLIQEIAWLSVIAAITVFITTFVYAVYVRINWYQSTDTSAQIAEGKWRVWTPLPEEKSLEEIYRDYKTRK